eukprot:TRINITY_DN486_c0_g1_i6.p1 TRINITY_DN486_c0_g1~~TRINITY_DN486_c0_g1_i6.p1  ORF type:complete len:427 (-),score=179.41 TRINITY_DN486_c0_g1_i6:109-1389(-)
MCIRDRYQRRVHGKDYQNIKKKINFFVNTMKVVVILAILVLAVSSQKLSLKRRQIKDISEIPNYEALNGPGKITLLDFANIMYAAEFSFGRKADGKPYKLTFDIDTGSGVLWTYQNVTIDPKKKTEYDCTKSSTQKGCLDGPAAKLVYGSAQIEGKMGSEVVSVPELGIPEQRVETMFVNKFKGSELYSNGLMGANNNKTQLNFMEIAVKAGDLPDSIFAFDLENPQQESDFYIGSDSFPSGYKKEDLEWLDVVDKQYWAVKFVKTYVGKNVIKHLPGDKSNAVIDSGSSISMININAYEHVKSAVKNNANCHHEGLLTYYCTCSSYNELPEVTFEHENGLSQFTIKPEDYLIRVEESSEFCMVGWMPITSQIPFILLGDTFMRNFFVAYDKSHGQYGKIGLKVKSVGPMTQESFIQQKLQEMKEQ